MINGSILLIFQQVESDFALNAWQYIMVTWARENGLALYINGTEVTRARGYMPQEGEHDRDSYTRLIVGRNAAGTPYGYTRMVASSLAFFDAEVPAESAKDMFLYFSSNGKSLGTLLSFFFLSLPMSHLLLVNLAWRFKSVMKQYVVRILFSGSSLTKRSNRITL